MLCPAPGRVSVLSSCTKHAAGEHWASQSDLASESDGSRAGCRAAPEGICGPCGASLGGPPRTAPLTLLPRPSVQFSRTGRGLLCSKPEANLGSRADEANSQSRPLSAPPHPHPHHRAISSGLGDFPQASRTSEGCRSKRPSPPKGSGVRRWKRSHRWARSGRRETGNKVVGAWILTEFKVTLHKTRLSAAPAQTYTGTGAGGQRRGEVTRTAVLGSPSAAPARGQVCPL